ncbi:hypothetical protein IFR05_016704 [Cadophora sp. M221]|nr:hypothetical protein IFR05_016704 [Cadophora sp. M221]
MHVLDKGDFYDPDNVGPRKSPLLEPTMYNLVPSPSPPPVGPFPPLSATPSPEPEYSNTLAVQAMQIMAANAVRETAPHNPEEAQKVALPESPKVRVEPHPAESEAMEGVKAKMFSVHLLLVDVAPTPIPIITVDSLRLMVSLLDTKVQTKTAGATRRTQHQINQAQLLAYQLRMA